MVGFNPNLQMLTRILIFESVLQKCICANGFKLTTQYYFSICSQGIPEKRIKLILNSILIVYRKYSVQYILFFNISFRFIYVYLFLDRWNKLIK